MRCFHPVSGYRSPDGTVKFAAHGGVHRPVTVRCGQCVGCRITRARGWAVRCVHEKSLYDASSFVTLTYDDEKLWRTSLCYRDFQLFMKRLRKLKGPVRFYMAGEYGELYGRPHYHAILFGCHFEDREYHGKSPSGAPLWRSAALEALWPHGFSSIGDVTLESAAYVARYCMKKITGSDADAHYEAVDGLTGEVVQRCPEFNRMSLRPGIGATWYDRYSGEVRSRDGVVVDGNVVSVPRYYDVLLKRMDAVSYEYVLHERAVRADVNFDDGSPERLRAQEICAKARLSPRRLK